MIDQLNDYDWSEVFGEGNGGNCTAIEPRRIPGETCSLDSFGREDVADIYGISEGENDERDWIVWGKLKDGRYFIATGGCDFTGWDCQARNTGNVAETKENLIQFAMTPDERKRFGIEPRGNRGGKEARLMTQRKHGMPAEPKRPAWLDAWLDYPHTLLSVQSAREVCWYVVALEEELQLLRNVAFEDGDSANPQ